MLVLFLLFYLLTSTQLTASETSTHNRNTSITCLSAWFLQMHINQQTFSKFSPAVSLVTTSCVILFFSDEKKMLLKTNRLKAKLGTLVPILQIWNSSYFSKNCLQFPVFSDHYFLYVHHSVVMIIIIQGEENGARTPPDLWSTEEGKTQTKATRTNSSAWPWTPRGHLYIILGRTKTH